MAPTVNESKEISIPHEMCLHHTKHCTNQTQPHHKSPWKTKAGETFEITIEDKISFFLARKQTRFTALAFSCLHKSFLPLDY